MLCLPSYLTMLAQKIPSASFEDLSPLAEDAAEVFVQCCDSVAEDCMQNKVGQPSALPRARGLPEQDAEPQVPSAPPSAVIGAHCKGLRHTVDQR